MFKKKQFSLSIITDQAKDVKNPHYFIKLNHALGLLKRVITHNDKNLPSYDTRSNPYLDYTYEWRFKNQPLTFVNAASCETTQSMLMYGYGKNDIDKHFEAINNAYDFSHALPHVQSLLSLLDDGYYTVSYVEAYPTDGVNRFFWDIPQREITSFATGPYYQGQDGLTHYGTHQSVRYLYPSEASIKYNEQRVNHYIDMYKSSGTIPFVVTLKLPGSLSLCLDGHHKVCACAKLGMAVPTIEIEPALIGQVYKAKDYYAYANGVRYPLKTKEAQQLMQKYTKIQATAFPETPLNTRDWSEYAQTLKAYPNLEEMMLYEYLNKPTVDQEFIDKALHSQDIDALTYLMYYLKRTNTDYYSFLTSVLLFMNKDFQLNKQALTELVQFKNDETESFLIDFLVELPDHSGLKAIALSYWES